ncbi:cytokine-inducible SH2-containing protein-like [Nelusetta ayraudi]|uniref:cytokine-inducible SH2-containing protein-like n=1 Tax=Nelusetta ayraudi TaxID=303726 RepID=UPI003F713ACC
MVAHAASVLQLEEQKPQCCPHPPPPLWDPSEDVRCIATTFQYLQASGWYWGSISVGQAREALLKKSEGTFLVRDSSHPRHLLALSVKTCCGPTSVRVEYGRGSFWLDSVSPGLPSLHTFPDVLSLVQHYVSSVGATPPGPPEAQPDPAWPAAKDSGVPLRLTHALHRPQAFPSLQHLTRLAINRSAGRPELLPLLPLPRPLLRYLLDYPFHV